MGEDEFLKRYERDILKKREEGFKRGYKSIIKLKKEEKVDDKTPFVGLTEQRGYNVTSVGEASRGKHIEIASSLMSIGAKKGNLKYALRGAELYDQLGVGNRVSVKRRLLRAYENAGYDESLKYDSQVRKFLEDHPKSGEKKARLEDVVKIIIGIGGITTGMFFLSRNITGQVIGSLSNPSSNVLGAALLVAGIVGFYSFFKNR